MIASYHVDALIHVDALSTALVPTVRHVRNVQLEIEIGVITITTLLKLVSTRARPTEQRVFHHGIATATSLLRMATLFLSLAAAQVLQ